jgi:hypothetical protein
VTARRHEDRRTRSPDIRDPRPDIRDPRYGHLGDPDVRGHLPGMTVQSIRYYLTKFGEDRARSGIFEVGG